MLYHGDLPTELADTFIAAVQLSMDTETTGLNPIRDRLCLVQILDDQNTYAAVKIIPGIDPVNLKRVLASPVRKLFHYARFDMGFLYTDTGVMPVNVFCTKLASKVGRTWAAKHGLANVVKDLLNVEMDKSQATTDWGAENITDAQALYARGDVEHLAPISLILQHIVARENRDGLLEALLEALPGVVRADCSGFGLTVFDH